MSFLMPGGIITRCFSQALTYAGMDISPLLLAV